MKRTAILGVFLFVCLGAGCAADPGAEGGGGGGQDGGGSAGGDGGVLPAGHTYQGVYALSAPIDLAQPGALPNDFGALLSALSDLRTSPGKAVVKLVLLAGGEAADAISSAGFGRSLAESLLDSTLSESFYGGASSVGQFADTIEDIARLVRSVVIHDELTLQRPNAQGVAMATHAVTGVTFSYDGTPQHVQIGTPQKVATTAQITSRSSTQADADLALGTATLKVPIGELVLEGAGPLLQAKLGVTSVKDALTKLFDCTAIGQKLSDGVSGNISPETGKLICDTGVAVTALEIEKQLKAYTWDGVQVLAGRGRLVDASAARPQPDRQADRIQEGTWTWRFTIDGQSADVTSAFEGDRIGTVP